MVDINKYLNVGGNTPVLSNSPVDQNSILNSGNQVTNAANNLLGQDLQNADQSRREALRANIVLKETKHQADLNLQESYIKTNSILLDSLNKITAIDEASRKEEEKKNSVLYNINTFSKLNTEFSQFLNEAQANMSPDGSGYTQSVQGFLDNKIKEYVDNAPSEDAKFDIYTKTSEFKLKAIQQSLETEAKVRDIYRIGLIDDTANQMLNQVTLDPNIADSKAEELNQLKPVLLQNGFNENQANQFLGKKQEELRSYQVQSLLGKGLGNEAENLLNREDVVKSISPDLFNQLSKEVINFQIKDLKRKNEEIELANAVEGYHSGLLPKGDPMFGKAADASADYLLFNQLPSRPAFTIDNIPQASGMLNQYFKQHPNGIGPQTANKINSVIATSTNPFEVVGYALGISSLLKDPTGRAHEVVNSLDKDNLTLANRISELVLSGTPSNEAVILAKKETEDGKNLGLKEWAKEVITGEDPLKLMESTLDAYNIWYPTESAALYKGDVQTLFESNLLRYKNKDLAQEATITDIKNKYAVSNINGSNEIMEAAPEMFYNSDVLSIFKDTMNKDKVNIAKELGAEDNGDGTFNSPLGKIKPVLRPIPNVTRSQPVDRKSYMWFNELTGAPLMNPNNGMIAKFEFNFNSSTYTKKLKDKVVEFDKQRSDLKNMFDDRIALYNKQLIELESKGL